MADTSIDALGSSGAGAAAALTSPSKSDAFSALTSEDFVKIMFTELGNQDPLKPNDSSQLVQQMANLRSIQSDLDMSKKLESLVSQNQLASAGGLIGKSVSGLDDDNKRVSGVVKSVLKTGDGAVLSLEGGGKLPFGRMDQLFNTPADATAAGAAVAQEAAQ
jgi:flagellar basal-body rod modification protein FlgD